MIEQLLARQWLQDYEYLYQQPTSLGVQRDNFFKNYTILTGVLKKPTSCGRCVSGMRLQFKDLKKLQDTMKKYQVYRTNAGNLSFKKNGEPIFTIHTNSELEAKSGLQSLKDFEKREAIKIETTGHGG